MKVFISLILGLMVSTAWGKGSDVYQMRSGLDRPLKAAAINPADAPSVETLKVRTKITKNIIIKTPEGFKVEKEPICEKDTTVEVKNLVGGGFITEEVFASCVAMYKGYMMNVITSGMVYDNIVADFSDEKEAITRNFFTHLYLNGELLTGLGDFNLDNSRDLMATHWAAHLSYDARYTDAEEKRETFTATIRFTR